MFSRKHLASATIVTLAATVAVVVPLATSATTESASATTTRSTCTQVVVIGVRGSTQPAGSGNLGDVWATGGLGDEAQSMADYATAHTDKTVSVVGLDYPAQLPSSLGDWLGALAAVVSSSSINAAAMPGTVYGNSVQAGVNALRDELNTLARTCPRTETALIGYSQGAQVIGNVIANNALAQLSPTARRNLEAAALEGDPTYRAGEPWDADPVTGNGLFARAPSAFSHVDRSADGTGGRVLSWCNSGDLVCQSTWNNWSNFTAALQTHTTSYENVSDDDTVGAWIVSKL